MVIVFNDNAYGNVLRGPDETSSMAASSAPSCTTPIFVRLAEAYGARGVRVEDPGALESALREALAVAAPALIEVPVGPMPYPY